MLKLLYFLSILANAAYLVILNKELYIDRFQLPDGEMGELHRSPIDSLYTAGAPALLYLQILAMIISVVSSFLLLIGVKNRTVRIVQLVAMIVSTAIFVIILLYTKIAVHPSY